MGANPYRQYQKVQVETAGRGSLLLMLYEGALRFLRRARKSLEEGDLQGAHNNLLRVEDIISELMASLDLEKGGEVAPALYSLYDFMYQLLLEANLKKEPQPLDVVEKMLEELRDAWKEVLGENRPPSAVTVNVNNLFSVTGKVKEAEKVPAADNDRHDYKEFRQGEEVLLDVFDKLDLTR